jgi:hypothetical protein
MHFIRLERYGDYEIVVINVADIVLVTPGARGTSIIGIRNHPTIHVMESVNDVHRQLVPRIDEDE